MKYQILEWDTDLFGMKIANVAVSSLLEENFSDLLFKLKQENVKLVYCVSEQECDEGEVSRLCGTLVDAKTIFTLPLLSLKPHELRSLEIVEPYSKSMIIEEFEKLAIQSGEFSRFAVDPNFPRNKFVSLYKTWIQKSLAKEIAREVLVIREFGQVVAMVTLGEKKSRGDIGLIAVKKSCRGQRYGEKLIRAAQKWFVENGYVFGQVVTQGMNKPACSLYRKCGYSIEKVVYYYHFWL